jgi:hypothetical protein
MKKTILILATVIFSANLGTAQDTDTDLREKALFGLKAGANYSNVYDSRSESFHANPKIGLAAGAFMAIPIGKYLGVQPEILYSQKGFEATGISLGTNYQFTRTTSYIDVPLLFSLKPVKFLSIHAGPQYSYLINQKDVFTYSSTSIEQEQDFKNDNIRKNTLCFIGGADINLGHFIIGARAGWDLQNNNGNGTSTTPRYKNVWYQGTIGYRFYN